MACRASFGWCTRAKLWSMTVIPRRNRYYWEARPENKHRKILMQVTLPRLGRSPDYEPKVVKPDEEKLYGLDVVLHREANEIFHNCKMVAVFLQAQMEITDFFRMKHELRKMDILLDDFPNHVMSFTLKNSKFQELSKLYAGETLTVYSLEPKVAEMHKITKKSPFLSLMGGIVEDRLMSANQMIDYSKLPSIEQLHGSLSFSLSHLCSSTRILLQKNQMQTLSLLGQYMKDKS